MSNYCPLPFRHVLIEPRGIKPCCSYTRAFNGTVGEWLSSNELYKLQQDILNDRIHVNCRPCLENERKDNISTRLLALKDYNDTVFTQTDIDYVDYRSINLCNFKCRSCEPYYSNGIAAEVKRNTELIKFFLPVQHPLWSALPPDKVAIANKKNYKWITDNLQQINRLMFTGGEPTLVPEVKDIINHIIDNNIQTVNILITSNASFTDMYWADVTKKLPNNLHWTLSVDAIGHNAMLIRDGTNWETVSYNVETMFDVSGSVNIGTVITNLNLLQLKPLFYWANDLAKKYQHKLNDRSQIISICNWPKRMSPYNWPDPLKHKVLEYLETFDHSRLSNNQISTVKMLIKNINDFKFDPRLWAESEDFNQSLDQIRKQNHYDLFKINE